VAAAEAVSLASPNGTLHLIATENASHQHGIEVSLDTTSLGYACCREDFATTEPILGGSSSYRTARNPSSTIATFAGWVDERAATVRVQYSDNHTIEGAVTNSHFLAWADFGQPAKPAAIVALDARGTEVGQLELDPDHPGAIRTN
jgi:hypothetical protein